MLRDAVVGLLILLTLLGVGIYRRSAHWNATSWWRFSAALAISLLLEWVTLRMAAAVDAGIYARLSPWQDRAYFRTLMTLGTISPLILAGLCGWLAFGDPTRPFGRSRQGRIVRRDLT